MKRSKLILASLFCLVAITPFVWSQAQSTGPATQAPSIPGYLNPATHVFTARAANPAVISSVAPTTVLARLVFTFNFMYNDQGPAPSCGVNISTDDSGNPFIAESATNTGTNTSCTVTILFQWSLTTPNTDVINVDYFLGTAGGFETSRSTEGAITNLAMPTNGQTVNVPTVTVVL